MKRKERITLNVYQDDYSYIIDYLEKNPEGKQSELLRRIIRDWVLGHKSKS